MSVLDLVVADIVAETPTVRSIRLRANDGATLPAFTAGAHITLAIPGIGARKYSLVETSMAKTALSAPTSYRLAVRVEDAGEGGSLWVHALRVGDAVSAEPPQNNFPLKNDGASLLVGGGIGITPLITMAAALRAAARPVRMLYAARNTAEFAFLSELDALLGPDLTLHADDTAGGVVDVVAQFAAAAQDQRVYMCGPKPMLKAGMDAARKLGWPRERLAFELFYSVASAAPRA